MYVQLQAGPDGLRPSRLVIETPDSEDVGTMISAAVPKLEKNETHTVLAYAKPGNLSGNFKIKLRVADGEEFSYPQFSARPLEIGGRLYLVQLFGG